MYMHTYIHTCADLGSLPNGVISVRVDPLRCWPWYSHHCDLTKLLTLQNAACLPGLLSLLHTVHGVEEHTVNTQPWKLKASVGLQLLAFLGPEQLSSCFPPFPSLSLCASIHVWFYMYVCICICGGQRTTLGAMRQVLSTVLFLWYRISLAWNSPGRVISLSRDPKHPPTFASSYWVPSAHYHPWLCFFQNVVSGDWTHTLMLARQLLYQLNY